MKVEGRYVKEIKGIEGGFKFEVDKNDEKTLVEEDTKEDLQAKDLKDINMKNNMSENVEIKVNEDVKEMKNKYVE